MKVLIVGAGVSGLTLANVLESAGIEYHIVERSIDGDPERQGYIVGIWSNGRRMLQRLGLSDGFDGKIAPTREARFCTGSGALLKRVSYKPLESRDLAGLACIKRVDLYSLLKKRVPDSTIRYNLSPQTIEQVGEVVRVTFSDGSVDAFDVVVGADGAKSFVREHCFKEHVETYTNWRVWSTWIPQKFQTEHALVAYVEPNELAVVVHTHDAAMVWLVTPTNHTEWDTEAGRRERVQKYFSHIPVLIPESLQNVSDAQLRVGDFMEVKMKHISNGRVAIMGDAAHCLGPYTGFSSSVAMEDAYVLGVELAKAQKDATSVPEALARFERRRMPKIEQLRFINSIIRALVLSRSRIVRSALNTLIRLIPSSLFVFAAGLITKDAP